VDLAREHKKYLYVVSIGKLHLEGFGLSGGQKRKSYDLILWQTEEPIKIPIS